MIRLTIEINSNPGIIPGYINCKKESRKATIIEEDLESRIKDLCEAFLARFGDPLEKAKNMGLIKETKQIK